MTARDINWVLVLMLLGSLLVGHSRRYFFLLKPFLLHDKNSLMVWLWCFSFQSGRLVRSHFIECTLHLVGGTVSRRHPGRGWWWWWSSSRPTTTSDHSVLSGLKFLKQCAKRREMEWKFLWTSLRGCCRRWKTLSKSRISSMWFPWICCCYWVLTDWRLTRLRLLC